MNRMRIANARAQHGGTYYRARPVQSHEYAADGLPGVSRADVDTEDVNQHDVASNTGPDDRKCTGRGSKYHIQLMYARADPADHALCHSVYPALCASSALARRSTRDALSTPELASASCA
jgi:hypothetical protein